MDDEVRIWTEPGLALEDPLIVVGTPTLGLVGTIVSHYLHDTLEMEPAGGLRSPYFPPVGRVKEGRPRRPFGMYILETSCGLEGDCEHLVVVESDFLPHPAIQADVAKKIVAWARDHSACRIVVPDGLMVQGGVADEVHGVGSSQAAVDRIRKLDLEVIDQGILGGLSSLLLFEGEEQGVETISLLAESAPDHPDARAAARLVQILDRIVPEVTIETEPLREEAERIEEAVRENREMFERQSEGMEGPGPESMMFG